MSVIKSNVATSRFPFFTATHSKVTIIPEELDGSKKFKLNDINSVAITKVEYFSDKDKSNHPIWKVYNLILPPMPLEITGVKYPLHIVTAPL